MGAHRVEPESIGHSLEATSAWLAEGEATGYIMVKPYSDLRDRTICHLRTLKDAGIQVSPVCRFWKYVRQLEAASRADGISVPDGLDLPTWHRSLNELEDLDLITSNLTREPAVAGWERAVDQMLSGGTRRTDEVKHSRARDIQFELVLAAMWRQAGYGVELLEPDVVVTSTNPQFGIAAKRPRTVSNLTANIRKANSQIARSGRPGIIAIDLTCLLNPTDVHISTADFRAASAFVIQKTDSFIDANASRIVSLVDPQKTFGVAVHFAMPILLRTRPALGWSRRLSISNLCNSTDPRASLLAETAERMATVEWDR